MPHVVIAGQAARRFTGGVSEFDVEANNFRRLVLELERRYPGLGHQVEEGMAVANAINDAIGVRMRDLPMSPPRLRAAIDKNGG